MSEDTDDDGPVMIEPPNRIKAKVTLNGRIKTSGMDKNLLKQAEANAESMTDTLVGAALEDIERLQAACVSAEANPAESAPHLSAALAAAHELKSYGKNIGYDLITEFSHSLALFLRKTNVPAELQVPIVRVHADAIRLVYHQELKGDGGPIGAELAKGLGKAIAKFSQ